MSAGAPTPLPAVRRLPVLLFGLWGGCLAALSYSFRFWISADTIGSLEAAEAMRQMDFPTALNAYFGQGYATIIALSGIPIRDVDSFFLLHLVTSVLVLLTQICIYKTLRLLNVSTWLSLALSFTWGFACLATGSGIKMTADVPVCLFTSAFIHFFLKWAGNGVLPSGGRGMLLGGLHGLAGITKTIAFLTKAEILVLYVAYRFIRALRGTERRRNIKRTAVFAAGYLLPLVALALAWGVANQSKYDRFTLGETGSHNYALCVLEAEDYLRAQESARTSLPPMGSTWWSDPGLCVTGWDRCLEPSPTKQIATIRDNLSNIYTWGPFTRDGFALILLLTIGLGGLLVSARKRETASAEVVLLALVGFSTIPMYLSTFVIARYLPFTALYVLPLCGLMLERLLQDEQPLRRWCARLPVLAMLLHGAAILAIAPLFLAPEGQYFEVAEKIRQKTTGPIGVERMDSSIRSYGMVAFLSQRKAAELIPVPGARWEYTATFTPGSVLMICDIRYETPERMTVDDEIFHYDQEWLWQAGGAYQPERFTLYRRNGDDSG